MGTKGLRFPAIKVTQPFGEFLITRIPASFLLKVSYSVPAKAVAAARGKPYEIEGTQRLEDPDKLKNIGSFIDTVDAVFPTSLILAANFSEAGFIVDDEDIVWRTVDEHEDGSCKLEIPTAQRLASIVDGQHRLHGFQFSKDPSRLDMEIPCSIFLDLPSSFQAFLFATVNFNQKKVDRSLAYELFGFDTEDEPASAWPPEKLAVFLCRKLNTDPDSPFRGRIVIAPQADKDLEKKNNKWQVSTATIVDGFLRLFSSDPAKDRDVLRSIPSKRNRVRTVLGEDSSPLRELYRNGNDLAIYAMAKNFFEAANQALWQKAPDGSYITRTVGIQALFDVLKKQSESIVKDKDIRPSRFLSDLSRASKLPFDNNLFQASGKGRTRLRHILMYYLKMEDEKDFPEGDLQAYKDFIRLAGGR